jgi:hypothetical protein
MTAVVRNMEQYRADLLRTIIDCTPRAWFQYKYTHSFDLFLLTSPI